MYDSHLPENMEAANPDLALALNGKYPTHAPWSSTATLNSLGGQEFVSFAKFTDFEAGTLVVLIDRVKVQSFEQVEDTSEQDKIRYHLFTIRTSFLNINAKEPL